MTLLFRCGSCGYDYPRRFFPWWSVGRCKVCRALGPAWGRLVGEAFWVKANSLLDEPFRQTQPTEEP